MTGPKKPAAEAADDSVFDLDAYVAEARHKPFRFKLGGKVFTAKHIDEINWLEVAGGEDFDLPPTGHRLFRAALGDQWDEFKNIPLPGDGYSQLQTRWQKHGGVDVGKSTASDGSSESTPGQ